MQYVFQLTKQWHTLGAELLPEKMKNIVAFV